MEYSSSFRVVSEKCEGVAFTLLRMTYWRRQELVELQAAVTERVRAIRERMAPLSLAYRAAVDLAKAAVEPARAELVAGGMTRADAEEQAPLGTVDFPDDQFRELVKFGERAKAIDVRELTPIAIGYMLQGIEGLTIDGEPATIDLVRQRGPDSLYAEIADAVRHEIELSTEERENLPSPSTSAEAVDGEKKAGSATRAGTLVTITSGVAPSSMAPASASVMDTA
jgi:hypothetical protein